MIHWDIKAENILVYDIHNKIPIIKIADFGFSKLLSNEDYTSTMLGSPLNMAP